MTIALPFLIALIGLLVYALVASAKLCEIGRIMFFTGLFIGLLRLGSTSISMLK